MRSNYFPLHPCILSSSNTIYSNKRGVLRKTLPVTDHLIIRKKEKEKILNNTELSRTLFFTCTSKSLDEGVQEKRNREGSWYGLPSLLGWSARVSILNQVDLCPDSILAARREPVSPTWPTTSLRVDSYMAKLKKTG